MCGFLFAISTDAAFDREHFCAARDTLTHRGPDGCGYAPRLGGRVAMGHRRLKILDLTDAGAQPMTRGDLTIVYNGEVYNFRELRSDLEQSGHAFETGTDTEVLLAGYREWGEALPERLHGMFALAIWDNVTRRAFLARDRVGQKPLYLLSERGLFVAASEIKAITALVKRSWRMRDEAPLDLLVYAYVPEPHTWYRDVNVLLPGHSMTVEVPGLSGGALVTSTREYWGYRPARNPRPVNAADALERVDGAIRSSVASHMLADVEVGAFLSGGLDSTAVVAVAAEASKRRLKTYCVGYERSVRDERDRARDTAVHLRTMHTDRAVTDDEFASMLADMDRIFDQPFGDTSQVPTARVAQLAAKQVKVVLTGDGGDEVFGGYPHYPRRFRMPSLTAGRLKHRARALGGRIRGRRWWQRRDNFGHMAMRSRKALSYIGPDLRLRLRGFDPLWYYRKHWDLSLDPFRRAQWLDIKTYLPSDILVKVDRCCMQHSLEARPPLLDHTLIELALDLPTDVRNPHGELKALFSHWLADVAPGAPALVAPKLGFGYPLTWAAIGGGGEAARAALEPCIAAGILEPTRVPSLLRKIKPTWMLAQLGRALERGQFMPR